MTTKTLNAWQERLADYKKLMQQGLWNNNQALVALLGLCPLLAVSNNSINGLGLGLATLLVLVSSNLLVSLVRDWVPNEIRIPVFIAIITVAVTVMDLIIHAYFFTLHGILGIFIPLIATNCVILGRAEAYASKNTFDRSIIDAIFIGLGFTAVLVVLGGIREIVGNGTLFDQSWLLFGEVARNWTIHFDSFQPIILAILPPGAFITLGLIIATKNYLDARAKKPINKLAVEVKSTPTQTATN